MKIFYDSAFNNELVSIGATTGFSVVSSASTVNVYYNDALPSKIYYSLDEFELAKNYASILAFNFSEICDLSSTRDSNSSFAALISDCGISSKSTSKIMTLSGYCSQSSMRYPS